jgi:hypothetical protein
MTSSEKEIYFKLLSDEKIIVCSGQLIPDSKLVRFSAFAGGTPLLN